MTEERRELLAELLNELWAENSEDCYFDVFYEMMAIVFAPAEAE